MAKLKLFTYHVILHPKDDEKEDSKLIIKPTTVLAKNKETLAFKVTREIPEEYVDSFERIEIGIAPFKKRAGNKGKSSSRTSSPDVEITSTHELGSLLINDLADSKFNLDVGNYQYAGTNVNFGTPTSEGSYFNAAQTLTSGQNANL